MWIWSNWFEYVVNLYSACIHRLWAWSGSTMQLHGSLHNVAQLWGCHRTCSAFKPVGQPLVSLVQPLERNEPFTETVTASISECNQQNSITAPYHLLSHSEESKTKKNKNIKEKIVLKKPKAALAEIIIIIVLIYFYWALQIAGKPGGMLKSWVFSITC